MFYYVETLLRFVCQQSEIVTAGKRGNGNLPPCDSKLAPVLLFSPHPDDESITGLLPLRLRLEEGRPVINIAVTLGSRCDRREQRREELERACEILGFAVEHLALLQNNPEYLRDESADPGNGEPLSEKAILSILHHYRPALVVYPHELDGHPTHEAVSRLLGRTLRRYGEETAAVLAAETECWQPMPSADLAVEGSVRDVAMLCEAISMHSGEVARNPFHVRQPIRMMENYFRAAELIGGFGSGCGKVSFAELYGLYLYGKMGKSRMQSLDFLPAEWQASVDLLRKG